MMLMITQAKVMPARILSIHVWLNHIIGQHKKAEATPRETFHCICFLVIGFCSIILWVTSQR